MKILAEEFGIPTARSGYKTKSPELEIPEYLAVDPLKIGPNFKNTPNSTAASSNSVEIRLRHRKGSHRAARAGRRSNERRTTRWHNAK
jgi:hypothetical protein